MKFGEKISDHNIHENENMRSDIYLVNPDLEGSDLAKILDECSSIIVYEIRSSNIFFLLSYAQIISQIERLSSESIQMKVTRKNDAQRLLISVCNSEVNGMVMIDPSLHEDLQNIGLPEDSYEIKSLFISELFKFKGLGKALIAAAEQLSKEFTSTVFFLSPMTKQAIHFFKKNGYKFFSKAEFYIDDEKHVYALMLKEI